MAVRVVGKGNKERLVPLSKTAREVLEALGRPQGNVNIFTFSQGRRKGHVPSARWVEAKFREAALRAGLDPRRFTPTSSATPTPPSSWSGAWSWTR